MKLLTQGIATLKLSLSPEQQQQLCDFVRLLQKWNRAFNLTAICEPAKIVTHHLLDSLSIAPYITAGPVLDIGTGAGFPGVPLAIAFPHYHFTLLDGNGKKIRFLTQVKNSLGLTNIEPQQQRVEQLEARQPHYAIITARAVADLATLVTESEKLLVPNGRWLLMKGQYPEKELQGLSFPAKVHPLNVPGMDAARHVVEVIKSHA